MVHNDAVDERCCRWCKVTKLHYNTQSRPSVIRVRLCFSMWQLSCVVLSSSFTSASATLDQQATQSQTRSILKAYYYHYQKHTRLSLSSPNQPTLPRILLQKEITTMASRNNLRMLGVLYGTFISGLLLLPPLLR